MLHVIKQALKALSDGVSDLQDKAAALQAKQLTQLKHATEALATYDVSNVEVFILCTKIKFE